MTRRSDRSAAGAANGEARYRNHIEDRLEASINEVLGVMDTSSDEGEIIRYRTGGPGNPWVPAFNPGRGRRGIEDQ